MSSSKTPVYFAGAQYSEKVRSIAFRWFIQLRDQILPIAGSRRKPKYIILFANDEAFNHNGDMRLEDYIREDENGNEVYDIYLSEESKQDVEEIFEKYGKTCLDILVVTSIHPDSIEVEIHHADEIKDGKISIDAIEGDQIDIFDIDGFNLSPELSDKLNTPEFVENIKSYFKKAYCERTESLNATPDPKSDAGYMKDMVKKAADAYKNPPFSYYDGYEEVHEDVIGEEIEREKENLLLLTLKL